MSFNRDGGGGGGDPSGVRIIQIKETRGMAPTFIFGRQAPIVQKVDNAMTELKVLG